MGKQTDKQQIVNDLRTRLNWYIYEATEEEFDEAEVKAIVELLKVMEPVDTADGYFTAERALERFWKIHAERQALEEEFEQLKAGRVKWSDYPGFDDEPVGNEEEEYRKLVAELDADGARDDIPHRKAEDVIAALRAEVEAEDAASAETTTEPRAAVTGDKVAKKSFFRSKGFTKLATAAALVLAIFVGGTAGVYAEKEGFFHWVEKDDGRLAIINPGEQDADTTLIASYDTFEQLPDRYKEIVWVPTALLETFDLNEISVISYRMVTNIKSMYTNPDSEEFVRIIQKFFAEDVALHDTQLDSYQHVITKMYSAVKVQYFEGEDEGVQEFMAVFSVANQEYIVRSNMSFEALEQLISESIVVSVN